MRAAVRDGRIPRFSALVGGVRVGGGVDLTAPYTMWMPVAGQTLHVTAYGIALPAGTPNAGMARMRIEVNRAYWVNPVWTPGVWTTLTIPLSGTATLLRIEYADTFASSTLRLREMLLTA